MFFHTNFGFSLLDYIKKAFFYENYLNCLKILRGPLRPLFKKTL
jgi:hypothetical protein